MIDLLQAVQQLGIPATDPFPETSRYHGLGTAKLETAAGKIIVYLLRRFAPQPESLVLLQVHTVTQGDRLDNVTAAYLGDPEQFWRICDANRALRPDELTEEIGRRLRITLPQGVQGQPG
ncbi:MAG TPA: LysM domain-containing protein [Thermoanaerobaculia bacterium]|nr:LysM domain-containing protein [Thermoanaerobaculia bacterium]